MADRGRGRGRGGAGHGGRGGRGPGDIEDELDDNAAAAAAGGAGDEDPLDKPDDSPATRALHRVVGDLLKPPNAQLSCAVKLLVEVKKLGESHKADIGQVLTLIPAPSSAEPPPGRWHWYRSMSRWTARLSMSASTKREEWEAQAHKDRERSRFGGSSDKDDRYHKSSSTSKGSDYKKEYYKKP
ncbi:hypothetical protein HYH02_007495 [Chlamydomonas schloesseri]|uniref:Uncharacterized protein n=1 Tax=Chlamydomonas schloesseri TaxID=2026947 RepID=A0A835WHN6_9CHLO|nr:hypothetical protein HYH02_007495 [Chlamydomonas schloesseri]|eukprot:KAG2447572.1 hypothetical protein HYH02_007495 [Chlamydomonas schloesseri]